MQTLSSMFKALADKNRLRIVAALLQHDELCVCQLTELLGVAGATASRHLSLLQKADLVQSRKVGRWVYCRLRDDLPHEFPMDWLKEHLLQDSDIVKNMERMRAVLAENPEAICRKRRGDTTPAGVCAQNRTKKRFSSSVPATPVAARWRKAGPVISMPIPLRPIPPE
ncbi:ArsR/SmtB family transcription factor [Desulfopila inferna]|uniref:ArsR/SmtB family transcription factor n=1 Tax=Desulfopila inferna TaxID=468528 RepID=UPI001F054470|nr:metalloregulator ArsR/SmtB family transcription factor [Desulfopila inferna]